MNEEDGLRCTTSLCVPITFIVLSSVRDAQKQVSKNGLGLWSDRPSVAGLTPEKLLQLRPIPQVHETPRPLRYHFRRCIQCVVLISNMEFSSFDSKKKLTQSLCENLISGAQENTSTKFYLSENRVKISGILLRRVFRRD